jgi:hypothetical protein
MPFANEIIVDSTQRSRKNLASLNEPMVEFCLDTLMSPLRLAELREFDQRRDFGLEYGKIRSASAGVKNPLAYGRFGPWRGYFRLSLERYARA